MIVLIQPALPYFVKADKAISPSQLFEKSKSTDARGLASLQALAALSIFLRNDVNRDINGILTQYVISITKHGK